MVVCRVLLLVVVPILVLPAGGIVPSAVVVRIEVRRNDSDDDDAVDVNPKNKEEPSVVPSSRIGVGEQHDGNVVAPGPMGVGSRRATRRRSA